MSLFSTVIQAILSHSTLQLTLHVITLCPQSLIQLLSSRRTVKVGRGCLCLCLGFLLLGIMIRNGPRIRILQWPSSLIHQKTSRLTQRLPLKLWHLIYWPVICISIAFWFSPSSVGFSTYCWQCVREVQPRQTGKFKVTQRQRSR